MQRHDTSFARGWRPLAGLAAIFLSAILLVPGCATSSTHAEPTSNQTVARGEADTYSKDEVVSAVSDFFGVTAEAAGQAVARIFQDNGRPNAYIKGTEGSGAIIVGLRYGDGTLQMKNGGTAKVYWQGPSVGFDVGGNASKVFTLVYNLPSTDYIYRRFPGVEGSAYFIGGFGVNYQRDETVTLAPMRAGAGFRLGANVGYLAYTRQRNFLPF
ncbi:MAG: DUF1134 domain-containing protein [Alphaproteobacteria bacterium]